MAEAGEKKPRAGRKARPQLQVVDGSANRDAVAQAELDLFKSLKKDRNGIAATRENAVLILEGSPHFARRVAHCDFRGRVELDGKPLTDASLIELAHDISKDYDANFSVSVIQEAVVIVAMRHRVHPVRKYLHALAWDRVGRLATAARTYFGVQTDDDYHRNVVRKFFLQAIWRVMKPGCQADHMLVLEGPQGCGKSSAVRILGGEFSGAPFLDLGSKDAAMAIEGLWFVEMSEMDAMNKHETSRVKAWITLPVDRFRRPYGRMTEDVPRQCVIVGTTNQDRYIQDDTGGRRFWPLRVSSVQLDALAKDRDQLFAEAMFAYRAGEEPYFRQKVREQVEAQRDRQILDPWTEIIVNGLQEHFESDARLMEAASRNKAGVTMAHVAGEILKIPRHQQTPQTQKRIVAVLTGLGLKRKQHRTEGGKQEHWYAPVVAGTTAAAIFGEGGADDEEVPL